MAILACILSLTIYCTKRINGAGVSVDPILAASIIGFIVVNIIKAVVVNAYCWFVYHLMQQLKRYQSI